MANKLHRMHKNRQILLFLDRDVSLRTIEKEVKITRKTIAHYRKKLLETGVDFTELLKQSNQQLEQLMGLTKPLLIEEEDPRKVHFNSLSDYFHQELSKTGVTRLLLWQEYIRE